MAKIMDPILPILSVLRYWAIILGSFGGRLLLWAAELFRYAPDCGHPGIPINMCLLAAGPGLFTNFPGTELLSDLRPKKHGGLLQASVLLDGVLFRFHVRLGELWGSGVESMQPSVSSRMLLVVGCSSRHVGSASMLKTKGPMGHAQNS